MKLYNKQKAFNFEKMEMCIHNKHFYSDGNFVFDGNALKMVKYPSEISPNGDTLICNIIQKYMPADINDDSLVTCAMGDLKIDMFGNLLQSFIYPANKQARFKYINVDFLQYLDLKDCIFKTATNESYPIVIYQKNTLKPIGCIMPITTR